jgi:hypothetical protein
MTTIPTDEQLIKEIRSISMAAPHLMTCSNCANYSLASGECSVNHLKFQPFVRGCNGRFFVTDEESLLFKVKKDLQEQANDLEKIENLLALMISTACATSCFAQDLEERLKILRKMPTNQDKKSDIRKDLDLVEDVKSALARIRKVTDGMVNDMNAGLEKIDQQYRLYIERHINNLFKEGGKLNVKKMDGNLNNAMILCKVIGEFVRKCIGNKENYDAFFLALDNLQNDTPYGLTSKDLKRYELKDYD